MLLLTNGTQTQTTTFDTWGRVLSQTDGAGNTATTTYDAAGRVAAAKSPLLGAAIRWNSRDSATGAAAATAASMNDASPTDSGSIHVSIMPAGNVAGVRS